VYWVVRGAVFPATAETEQTTTRTPVLVVPRAATVGLPRIPRGTHLLAEQDTPSEVWIVRNLKRYRATPAVLTAGGLSGLPVGLVPPDGLNQIPAGGTPFWLGGLVVADSAGQPIEQWEPTPQVEGTISTTKVGLRNRTAGPIVVTGLAITSDQDAPGTPVFTVTPALPLTVSANTFMWVDVEFRPQRSGPIAGTVAVVCSDVTVPSFQIPLSTEGKPLGSHGVLQVTPGGFDLGMVRAGQPAAQNVTLTNVGGHSLSIGDGLIVDEAPPGQFTVPLAHTSQLGPGQSTTVYVSCTPTVRGRVTAMLVIDAEGPTDSGRTYTQRETLSLAATAQAPVAFLAGSALPPVINPGRPPFPRPPRPPLPRLVVELTRLDLGAAAPGATVGKPFWIRNAGDLPLIVGGLTVLPQAVFGVPDLSIFPATIAPGGEQQVDTIFLAPNTPGRPQAGELWIETDDPFRPRAVLALAGRVAGAHLATQPSEFLGLDSVPPTGRLLLSSDGTDPVELRKVAVSDPDFVLSGLPPLPATLAPGTSLTVDVTYSGAAAGQHDGTIDLTHNGSGQPRIFLRATL
jgi:hypothetical protein